MINPFNHYWIIAGSSTDVYSSATNTLVPVADATYAAWAANNIASPIVSEAELAAVIQAHNQLPAWIFNAASFIQPTPGTYDKPQLAAYNADARYRHASGGVTIGGKPYLTDPVSRNTVASAHDYAVANPGHVTQWKLADGTFIPLDEPGLAHVLQQMATFVQACFTAESTTVTSINSGGTTTLAQIDAVYTAISTVLA
jgi:hypothetical protein